MKKKIKDMTDNEKHSQIMYLSHKFYDIRTKPSIILHEEMQNADMDEYIQKALANLVTLETQRYVIEEECYSEFSAKTFPWRRIYEYKLKKLMEKHEAERSAPQYMQGDRLTIKQRQEQEIAALKQEHRNIITKIRQPIMVKLTQCNDQLRSVFMDAIHHLYR